MKSIRIKKLINHKKRTKMLCIQQKKEDSQCITTMKKNFFYSVKIYKGKTFQVPKPQIFIKKAYDTKKRTETFAFRVKGFFYIKHNRHVLKVHFRHYLNIHIQWKTKIFSPNKSGILTKDSL